jgi:hypothetical protein
MLKHAPRQQVEARNQRVENATLSDLAWSDNVGVAMITRLEALSSADVEHTES